MKRLFMIVAAMLLMCVSTYAQKVEREVMVVKYGNDQTFKHTISNVQEVTFEKALDWEYVDLGLPSGTLWATCNVGAEKPEDYGYYFAWGETLPKATYSWNTYKYCKNGDSMQLTKYCYTNRYGYNDYTDNLTELLAEDDAATTNPDWGIEWQTPSTAQQDELFSNSLTTRTWTTQNGVNGLLITSKKNNKSIFLPAAGIISGMQLTGEGSAGGYWSRSLSVHQTETNSNTNNAEFVQFDSNGTFYTGFPFKRCIGTPVRAVRKYKN